MEKIRAVIDRFEGEQAVLRNGGEDIIIPKKYLANFSEGDTVCITLASDKEDTEKNQKVAEQLLTQIFKEE